MTDSIEAYCAAHFDYNGLTEARRRVVRGALTDFRDFLGAELETSTAADFKAWLEHMLVERSLHPNTVRKYGNCVRPWYRWAWRDAHLVDAETALRVKEVPNPRGAVRQGLPRPYKRRQLDQFWAEFDARWPLTRERLMPRFVAGRTKFPRVSDYLMHVQIEAVVHLALHCGLRRSEILTSELMHIHPDNAYVVVPHGKGDKYREVPFTTDARRAVGVWLEHRSHVLRHYELEHDRPWVNLYPRASMNGRYPTVPATPISERRFGRLMSTIGEWELHRFRHTCGTEWLRAGMPVEKVKYLLGHENIQQTMGYVEVLAQDVQRDARRHEDTFTEAVGRRAAA